MAVQQKKYLNQAGLAYFYARLKEIFTVHISDDEDNQLVVKPGDNGGLYVGKPVLHKLTFGSDQNYVYDGTEDVTVPVYTGEYEP